jgi:hypothetical protein
MEFDPGAIRNPLLRRLYDHWNAKRAGRAFPARADFDPVELRWIIGNLLLVDVMRDPLRFSVRLHGTNLANRAGFEMTGKAMDDYPDPEYAKVALRSFTMVVETRRPFARVNERIIDGRAYGYETAMLPLSSDGEAIDMLLVGLVYHE